MKFSRISVTKKGVELDYERRDDQATEEVKWSSQHRPLSTFRDAVQSLDAFVADLIPFLGEIPLTVTTLNLSEDKNGHRGLIVTATTPIEKAYKKPLVLNTPLVREGSETASEEAFVLSDEVLELIALVEEEATRYKNGEHEQTEMFSKEERTASSENANAVNERMASAEVASTRKPKGKKKNPDFIPGAGDVMNPESTEPPMDDTQLRQLLLTVERDVGLDAIRRWSATDRSKAETWGRVTQKHLAGQFADLTPEKLADIIPAEPECIATDRQKSLSAEEWTAPTAPPKASAVTPLSVH